MDCSCHPLPSKGPVSKEEVLGCSPLQVFWCLLHSLASFLKAGGVFQVELVEWLRISTKFGIPFRNH
jgi:hypothetical protein